MPLARQQHEPSLEATKYPICGYAMFRYLVDGTGIIETEVVSPGTSGSRSQLICPTGDFR
jgi:hypothetical protein